MATPSEVKQRHHIDSEGIDSDTRKVRGVGSMYWHLIDNAEEIMGRAQRRVPGK